MAAAETHPHLGALADGVWLVDHPNCPRCGLRLHVDDPLQGYHPDGRGAPMKVKHATSSVTDRDGCIVGLGRAVAMLNDRLANLEHWQPNSRRHGW